MDAQELTTVELHEDEFDGNLVIAVEQGVREVRVAGTRPQDGALVEKQVPADRDPELAQLVERVVAGDDGAAVRLLAHVGVLDPE